MRRTISVVLVTFCISAAADVRVPRMFGDGQTCRSRAKGVVV